MLRLQLLWAYELKAETWSTPAISPVSAGASLPLVVCDRSGYVQALCSKTGALLWCNHLGAEITASPVAADVNGDGKVKVFVGDHTGRLHALDVETGETMWRVEWANRIIRATPAIADANHDGTLEVFAAVYGDYLYCLDGESGRMHWRRYLPRHELARTRGVVSSPLVADVNGDSRDEVVIGTRSKRAYCLDAQTGRLLWFKPFAYGVDSTPSCATVNGQPLVFIGSGEHTSGSKGDKTLYALRGSDGTTVWKRELTGGIDSSPTIGNIDGDGQLEVVVTTLADASCYAFDSVTGEALWQYKMGPTGECTHDTSNICRRKTTEVYFTGHAVCRSYTTPLLADVDGDGRTEVVVGSNNGHIYVLDGKTGKALDKLQADGIVRGSPVMLDVDGDGYDELFVAAGDRLLAFRTWSQGVCWPMFKGESRHLGWVNPDFDESITSPLSQPRWSRLRLLWYWVVVDTVWYILYQLERRLFKPLGIRLFDHIY